MANSGRIHGRQLRDGPVWPVAIMGSPSANGSGGSGVHIGYVGGFTAQVQSGFVRPADTTTYDANDAVTNDAGDIILFENAARSEGGSGYITKVRVITDDPTCETTFRLHLFVIDPIPMADNDPYALLWQDYNNRVGFIDLPAMTTGGTGSDAAEATNPDTRLAFVADGGSRNLYGILETLDGFEPQNSQLFMVELAIEQN